MSHSQPLTPSSTATLSVVLLISGPITIGIHIVVVLENNNKHLKQRLAEGLPLFRALLSSRQEVGLVSCRWVGLGEPEAAAVPSVRLSAW